MQDVYHDDLRDFIRHGRLDAYELTDEELAQFMELWRWSVYTRRTSPSSPDYDAHDMVNRLEYHLYHSYGVEIEYNTRLLLRQELEAMMHMNILREVPRAIYYFFCNLHLIFPTWRNIRRAKQVKPILGEQTLECRGYPRRILDEAQLPIKNILARRYWRRIGQDSIEKRVKSGLWW